MSNLTRQSAWANSPLIGPLMRTPDAAKYLGISRASYYDGVKQGLFPPPIKLGVQSSGVPKGFLDAVIADRVLKSTGGDSRG